jgi:hypothetical protein
MLAMIALTTALQMPTGAYEYRMHWPVRQKVRVRVEFPGNFLLLMEGAIRLPETLLDVNVADGWTPTIPPELQVALRQYRCTLLAFEYNPIEDNARVRLIAPLLGECTIVLDHVEE